MTPGNQPVQLKSSRARFPRLYLSYEQASEWQLTDVPDVRVEFGRNEFRARLQQRAKTTGTCTLPVTNRPPVTRCTMGRTERGVKIGPVVGVLTAKVDQKHRRPARYQLFSFGNLAKTAWALGVILFVFTPDRVDWHRRKVTGLYYTPAQGWREAVFPLPDVIYNRVATRQAERSRAVQDVISRATEVPGLNLFNPCFLNKWDLYRALVASPSTAPYLPETRLLTSQMGLRRFLRRYRYVYLKPVSSSLGKGVIRLEKSRGTVKVAYRLKGKNLVRRVSSWSELWATVQKRRVRLPYLMQKGIRLAVGQEPIFDVRTLVQRNQAGQWQVTGMGARVASTSGITTHVPNGGSIASLVDILHRRRPHWPARELLDQLHDLALRVPPALEAWYGHPFGEISLDIAVDIAGRLWVLEANAKPFKFDETTIYAESRCRLLQYCGYLAGLEPVAKGV
ncbi:MAG: YheC/YheD family protein [Bacillota bacterium]